MIRSNKLNFQIAFVFAIFFSSLFLVFFFEFKFIYVILLFINYLWFGLSSSLFIHRIVTHRAADLNPLIEFFFLLGSSISLSGSPISWAAVHRCHHAIPDSDYDPHSPLHGRGWAYIGWVMYSDEIKIAHLKEKYAKDLLKNKMYALFDHKILQVIPAIVFVLALYYFFGAGAIVWGFLLAGLLSYNFHWMLIASFCHSSKFGYRRFNTNDYSRNIPWLSLLSFGESLHNNHHKYPRTANLNSSFWEFDISYYTLIILSKLNLAKNVVTVDYKEEGGISEFD